MAVAMVILGVRYILDQLSEEFISETGDVIDQVVKKSAFLKLTKNPNPVVSFNPIINSVLMIRIENCPNINFPIVNLLTSPLIMYSKFVWSNLVWSVNFQSWLENV